MSETNQPVPSDLSGTVDERIAQLASLEAGSEQLPPEWVLRQLRSTLASWATDATEVDIEVEKRTDY